MLELIPFAAGAADIRIEASFVPLRDGLHVEFRLRDPGAWVLDTLAPGEYTADHLQRTDGLWKTTCFEVFWGVRGQPGYWELNLSPNQAQWNLYHFEGLRQPAPPRPSNDYRVHRLSRTSDTLLCELETSQPPSELERSLCAVVRLQDETLYYSERHASAKPDFHNRSAWSQSVIQETSFAFKKNPR